MRQEPWGGEGHRNVCGQKRSEGREVTLLLYLMCDFGEIFMIKKSFVFKSFLFAVLPSLG